VSSGRGLSIGVEEEFFLHDRETGRLLPRNLAVLEAARHLGTDLDLELTAAQIEAKTSVCWSTRELRAQLLDIRTTAAAAALAAGAHLVASGVSIGDDQPQAMTDRPRYRLMADRFGMLAMEHEISGCHVHVGVPDRETAVQVANHLRPWLPALLALTANSAVHRGKDTGHASWRSILAARWPCSGPPPYFTSAQHYDSTVAMMIDSGAILDHGMVYWDIRPSHHLPTVEVRVSDTPATVQETALLATVVRALVGTAIRAIQAGNLAPAIPDEAVRAACWRSAHDGLTGRAVNLLTSQTSTPSQLFAALGRHVRDELDEMEERQWVKNLLERVLTQGNGAMWQRHALAQNASIADVVTQAARRTLRDSWTGASLESCR
jgi:carboxylate-amine ligase